MTVVNHTANQLWLQLVKNQQKINLLVVAILAVFLLSYAAELTWRLWPQPYSSSSLENISISQSVSPEDSNSRLNLADIKRLNLFGDFDAAYRYARSFRSWVEAHTDAVLRCSVTVLWSCGAQLTGVPFKRPIAAWTISRLCRCS